MLSQVQEMAASLLPTNRHTLLSFSLKNKKNQYVPVREHV